MLPRPLHRWKSFWFGVLVLVFLGWSWTASMGKPGGVGIETPVLNAGVGYINGSMVLFSNESSGAFNIGFFGSPVEPEPTWFPSGADAYYSESKSVDVVASKTLASGASAKSISCGVSPAQGHIRAAHWLLIPLFLLVWTVFLYTRRRTMNRVPTGS